MPKKRVINDKVKKLDIIKKDFRLFAKNFIKIVDNSNELIPFDLNKAQKELDDLLIDNRFVVVGKARQSGISTYTLAKALWRALTFPNENILIVSYRADSSNALFEKLKLMNDLLPRDKYKGAFPYVEKDNRDMLYFDNGSKITLAVSSHKSVGRGSTFSWVHLSEFAFYTKQEQTLLSIEQSLAKGENSRLTIETTSNGTGNHYYKLFMSAYKGNSKYKSFFVPFYHPLYTKQFKFEYDEAELWFKNRFKYPLNKDNFADDTEKTLHELGCTYRQLKWRRYKLCDMTLEEFQQEYPSNPLESFISTGNNVFEQVKVLNAINLAPEPMERNEVIHDLPKSLQQYVGRGLSVYELPKYGLKYYAGVDVASGSGNDSSSISIYSETGEMALSFNHNRVPVYTFAEVLNEIGRYYNYAFMTVERNSYGLPVLERLRKKFGYLNLYKEKVFDSKTGTKKLRLGFTTSNVTKSILIADFKEHFEMGYIKIKCKDTLQQMQIFVESSNGSTGNQRGDVNHDDLVISSALVIQGIKTSKWYV